MTTTAVKPTPDPADLPAGTVTFLMTDVEGSTRLWDEHPSGMRVAIARHDGLLEEAVTQREGLLIKTRGEADGAFAVFRDAAPAVSCALHLQRVFRAEEWPEALPLRVRMALHTGEAELRGGDYYGPSVNRCARIRAIAYGEQTVLSEATSTLVRGLLPDGALLKDLGVHRLKDLDVAERVFQLVHPDLPVDFPPLKSLTEVSNNLPAQLTNFIGREKEVEEVRQLLTTTRLLTISGAGGLGKTRLALQVASEVLGDFANGVWLVELAPLADPDLVIRQVAQAVGVREEAGQTLLETLAGHLRPRTILFLFDNCEHVAQASATLAEQLLGMCPNLKIVATSQEPLRVQGETVWRIPPLPVPDPDKIISVDALAEIGSVRLFMDRAAQAKPDFSITRENSEAIAQVCLRLDGVPLAIELAAARVKMLTPAQINERLDERFQLLTGGMRSAPTRQQTLRAAVEWSHDLLADVERTMFRRLSVFAGGFPLDGAEEVSTAEDLDPLDVLDLVLGLVDKSLVLAEPVDGRVRYRMLESIRQFAADRLIDSGEETDLRGRHLTWYLSLVERAGPELLGSDQILWLDRLQEEHDNFRQALSWSARGHHPEAGLQMAVHLRRFWEMRGFLSEGRRWLNEVLSNCVGAPPGLQAEALNAVGVLASIQGDPGLARSSYEESLRLMRQVGNREGTARVLGNLGNAAQVQGDYEAARTLYEESLAIAREMGDDRGVARSLQNLGNIANSRGDLAGARALFEESLEAYRLLDDNRAVAIMLNNVGAVAFRQGDLEAAQVMWTEALEKGHMVGDKRVTALCLVNLGAVAWKHGDHMGAKERFEEGLAIRRELGDRAGIAGVLNNLAAIAAAEGDAAAARLRHEEGLAIRRELGNPAAVADSLQTLGGLALGEGDYERAKELFEESLSLRRDLGNRLGVAGSLASLGGLALEEGDHDKGRALFEESLAIARDLGNKVGIASALHNLGILARAGGDLERAAAACQESLAIRRELGDRPAIADSLVLLGRLTSDAGRHEEARVLHVEALQLAKEIGHKLGIARSLEALGGIAGAQGRWQQAGTIFGAAEQLREAIGRPISPFGRPDYERDVAQARAVKGVDLQAFEQEWAVGRAMSVEDALSLAIEAP